MKLKECFIGIGEDIRDNPLASLFILALITVFVMMAIETKKWEKAIRDHGVYSKATVVSYRKYKHKGTVHELQLEYRFQQKFYLKEWRIKGDSFIVEKEYYIRLLPENPFDIMRLYDTVPACLLGKPAPDSGWTILPACP